MLALALSGFGPMNGLRADTFGSGTNQFTIDFVPIGSPDNSDDTNGYGGVPYAYRIGKYTISQNQVDAAIRSGLTGMPAPTLTGNQPASGVTWYQAAAYVNWLNTSCGYAPAYKLSSINGSYSMSLWPSSQAWTNGGTNLYRNANSVYFLPSENEWYKAAYYDTNKMAGVGGYWLYATGSDVAPTPVVSGTNAGSAVYKRFFWPAVVSVFLAGGPSPFGTIGQGGNVWQMLETAYIGGNSDVLKARVSRGGDWYADSQGWETLAALQSTFRNSFSPNGSDRSTGFRVACVADLPPQSSPRRTTDSFGKGSNQFSIDFVAVGNVGNSNDATGYGGVPYSYRIGQYAISQNQLDTALKNGLVNVSAGAWTGDRPAANISWYEAAAYVNWLNTNSGYQQAYNLTWTAGGWSLAAWPSSQAWTNGGTNLFRNANCAYFLPSENEWYKAAFYDPSKGSGQGGYWFYPTGSDTPPTAMTGGTSAGTAVFNQSSAQGPSSVFQAGGLSPYGTMGQGGNIWQWIEGEVGGSNSDPLGARAFRGNTWESPGFSLKSSYRDFHLYGPDFSTNSFGFRIASLSILPTPSPTPSPLPLGNRKTQRITMTLPKKNFGNAPFQIVATASSGLPISYFTSSATNVVSVTGNTFTVTGTGTATITAYQFGDSTWLSNSLAKPLVVAKGSQTITSFDRIADKNYGDLPFAVIPPVASSGLPVAVSVTKGPGTVSSNTLTVTGAGIISLSANQAGNANYLPAKAVTTLVLVNKRSQSIQFSPSPRVTYVKNGTFPLSATTTSGLPLKFTSSTSSVISVSGTTASIKKSGNTTLTASQAGDKNWNAASISVTVTVE